MNHEQFEQIVERYRDLNHKEARLHKQCSELIYNTPVNSHHPLAFVTVRDALAHEDLTGRLGELALSKMKLANRAQEEGFPPERWIKLEGPDVSDDVATGVILREGDSGSHELIIEDWSLVLAEG